MTLKTRGAEQDQELFVGSPKGSPRGGSALVLSAQGSWAGPNLEEQDEEIVWGEWHG